MARQVLSGFNPGANASFSDAMVISFGKKAVLWDLYKRKGKQGIHFNGSAAKGHEWTCGRSGYTPNPDNARKEGSCEVDANHTPKPQYANQVQIFSKEASISNTAKAEGGACSRSTDMKTLQLEKREEMALDIDAALARVDGPVVSADNAQARKMAGIKHYVSAGNTFDLAGTKLDVDAQVKKMARAIYDAGITGEDAYLIAGSAVYDDIEAYYANKKGCIINGDSKTGGVNINAINSIIGKIGILPYHGFAADEFMIVVPKFGAVVPLREFKDKDITTPNCDSETRQDLIEHTFQVCPESLTWTKNAGRVA